MCAEEKTVGRNGDRRADRVLRRQTESAGAVLEVPATGKASHISSAMTTKRDTGRALTDCNMPHARKRPYRLITDSQKLVRLLLCLCLCLWWW